MWLLNQRSETHKSILHFLLFLVEFSNDTSKLPILPTCHFLFRWFFRLTKLNNAFVKVSGRLCTQLKQASTPKSKEPVAGASFWSFLASGFKERPVAFQTRSSSPRSTVQMQINLLLQAIICTLYLVRGRVESGVGGEGVRLDFEEPLPLYTRSVIVERNNGPTMVQHKYPLPW